jgi:phenylacetate-CoA ligase
VETKDGPTVWEDHFYPEVVDPETGAVLPDGEPGELVLTSLTKEAMPVIRYRTRDLTRLLPGTARPAMRRIERVTGRSDDMMIIRGVNVFPTQLEELILGEPELSAHFQCHLGREGNLDTLTVTVERQAAVTPGEAAAAARRVAERARQSVGVSITVEAAEPHTVERSAGKMRRIVDHRGQR